MCRGFSNGVSELEKFLKKQCKTSRGIVSSFKKTNQKRRMVWKQPKPIISTVDCLNSKHWGIKCGTKFKGYTVEKLKLKLKLIKLKNSIKTPSNLESISSNLSLTNNSQSFNSLGVGFGAKSNMKPVIRKNLEPEEVSKQLQKYFLNHRLKIPRSMDASAGSPTSNPSMNAQFGSIPSPVPASTLRTSNFRNSNAGGAKRTKKKKRKKYKSKKKI